MNATLGEKIKNYRKRAGISQMDLEYSTNSAPGSISRIESGTVNPTKEKLQIIADNIKLSSYEKMDLFEIPVDQVLLVGNTLNKISKLSINKEIDLDELVDIISEEFEYNSVALFLLDGNVLRLSSVSRNRLQERVENALKKTFKSLYISDDIDKENLILKSAKEAKVFESDSMFSMARGAVPNPLIKVISKILDFKKGILIPIHFKEKKFGTMYFAKPNNDDYSVEIPILKVLCEYISIELYKNEIRRED